MAVFAIGMDVRAQMRDAAHLEARLSLSDYAASISRRAGSVQRVQKLEVAGFLPDAPAGWVRRYFQPEDAARMMGAAPADMSAVIAEFTAAADSPAAQTVLNYSDGLRMLNVRIGPATTGEAIGAAPQGALTEVSPAEGWPQGYRAYRAPITPELELVVLGNTSREAVMQFWRGVDRAALAAAVISPAPDFSAEEQLALTPMPVLPEAMIVARAEYDAARVLSALKAQNRTENRTAPQIADPRSAGPAVVSRFDERQCRTIGAMTRCAAQLR
ncbi:hypothetical protein [Litorivita sp. NS0012-18]|uniref:hypothetical protein n=1 Tax=Litorivita sp. NS0012-18 TaxID=3127655 RepID=UPI0031056832